MTHERKSINQFVNRLDKEKTNIEGKYMNDLNLEIKLDFIACLQEVVLNEVDTFSNLKVVERRNDALYLEFVHDFDAVKKLRSATNAYVVVQNSKYNPRYIYNNKSIVGDLTEIVTECNENIFNTFEIICAGADSPEVRAISRYIQNTYRIEEKEEADLKIHIIKLGETWEVGVEITPLPLSVREYRVRDMRGAMNPTVAYALNSLSQLDQVDTYLNVFSGSGTLLIEAGQCYPELKRLVGFDNNKKHLSLSIQNIKKAGLIEKIQVEEADIFDDPDLGTFDVITSDLPFGKAISKDEDLGELYEVFVRYCEKNLNPNGKLVAYTSKHEIFKKAISDSRFNIIDSYLTKIHPYLHPHIFVCKLTP